MPANRTENRYFQESDGRRTRQDKGFELARDLSVYTMRVPRRSAERVVGSVAAAVLVTKASGSAAGSTP